VFFVEFKIFATNTILAFGTYISLGPLRLVLP